MLGLDNIHHPILCTCYNGFLFVAVCACSHLTPEGWDLIRLPVRHVLCIMQISCEIANENISWR